MKNAVRIFEPDHSLQAKIGITNLDEIFTKDIVARAQHAIEDATDSFIEASSDTLQKLLVAYSDFRCDPTQKNPALSRMIETAFAIKSQSSQGGNALAATIAGSLQRHAEHVLVNGKAEKMIPLMDWHIDNLKLFLKKKVKGYGGSAGESLLREIGKLPVNRKGN